MQDPITRRADPDRLLAHVTAAEEREKRGRLRIYFGASAGVGKTYAMISAAWQLKQAGKDVAIGFIETHGRNDTASLLASTTLAQIAPRMVSVKDRLLPEFDLDAALALHPELLLVDELPHTNLPGSRHPKRWQDVDELLAAGIDVYTALNVQHLESLRDVVFGITGVRVAETVPDTFFEAAAEVVLVDLPIEELLRRLAAGHVYGADQATRAAKNFFRAGNLLALRELALRRTAERVETDVQSYRVEKAIAPVWRTRSSLLCCVGPDPGDEAVVRSTARLASELGASWQAVYVETPRLQRLSESQRSRILGVIQLAQSLGASTAILSGSDIAKVLIEYARAQNHSRLIVGRAAGFAWPWRRAVAQSLSRLAPDVDLIELALPAPASSAVDETKRAAPEQPNKKSRRRRRYLLAAGASIATTLILLPTASWMPLTNLAMLFLLTVAVVAMRYGRGPAILAACLNVAAYDFFFIPPRFSFAVADAQYVITFAVMLAVGVIIGELTGRLRFQARIASHREARARELYQFARDLSTALQTEDVERISVQAIEKTFRAEVLLLLATDAEHLRIAPELNQRHDFEPAIASWTLRHDAAAGLGTDTLPNSAFLYLPLSAPMATRGVLAICPKVRRHLQVPEQAQQLRTFASLIAIALERVHYVFIAKRAMVSIESEKLRNSLLAAVSHDLRTPLAAVVGLADTLAASSPSLSHEQQSLATGIAEQSHRMSALVTNLLEMARIEQGEVNLNRQWQPLSEVVGGALSAMSLQLQLNGRTVKVELEDSEALVFIDSTLLERVLSNLIENAIKYSTPNTPIRLSSRSHGAALEIIIEDQGPGLPKGQEDHLFGKFVRGNAESAITGIGLGLAISRALVRAHGGELNADPSYLEGARFVISLPIVPIPPEVLKAADLPQHV